MIEDWLKTEESAVIDKILREYGYIQERKCYIRKNVSSIENRDGFSTCDLVDKCSSCNTIIVRNPWTGDYPNFCQECGGRFIEYNECMQSLY